MRDIGKTVCGVCGCEFDLVFEARYTTRTNTKTGITTIASNEEPELYDTIDCPYCGCQKIIQPRKRSLNGIVGVDIPDRVEEEENDE